ncbi:MAG: hypothetical protein ACXACA_06675, partial [Candidatus Ranarchaeia archaeon]
MQTSPSSGVKPIAQQLTSSQKVWLGLFLLPVWMTFLNEITGAFSFTPIPLGGVFYVVILLGDHYKKPLDYALGIIFVMVL